MSWNRSVEKPQTTKQRFPIKKASILTGVLVVVIAAGAITVSLFSKSKPETPVENVAPTPTQSEQIKPEKTEKPAEVKGQVAPKGFRKKQKAKSQAEKKKRPRRIFVEENLSPEDRVRITDVQTALDAEDFDQARAAAERAMQSENPEVRSEAVEALGWFGDKALVDLTKAMTDKNSEVADVARGQVEQALMGMDDMHRAFALAATYTESFCADKEAVVMFLGVMGSTGVQLADPDDPDSLEDVMKARAQRADVVTAISLLVEQGGDIAQEARETYELISSEEWKDLSAAEHWASDIPDPEGEEVPETLEEPDTPNEE